MSLKRAAVGWAVALVISLGLLALPLVAFAATFAVNIQNSAFAPPTTTVKVGDTVTWTNRDPFSHTATSNTGAWDTGIIAAGGSKSIVFVTAGTFPYHCNLHAFMTGSVVVQAVTTPQPTAPPTATPTAPPTAPPPPPTPLPTPVRTAQPTAAPTAPPTAAPTEAATTPPTASASASPTTAAAETLTVSASPSAAAVQLTPAPAASGGGIAPLLIGAAALAVVALGGIAFLLARRP